MGWLANFRNRRRLKAAFARRALEVAQTPAWTASWGSSTDTLNLDLQSGLATAVARSRALWRNNDYARRYRSLLLNNVLGPSGLKLQMRMQLRNGRPNDAVNLRLEEAWTDWGKIGHCDVTGKLDWASVESLALECLARDGEYLIRHVLAGPHGYQVQVIDPTLLDVSLNQQMSEGRRIVMGVEIDQFGKPLAYHLRNGGRTEFSTASPYAHTRVPANQIIHEFEAEEPGQVRGWPWTGTSARRLFLAQDFEQAAAVASSNAAKRVGFFVSPTGEAPPGIADTIVNGVLEMAKAQGKTLSAEEIEQLTAAAQKYATAVPGTFDTLPSGYDFRPFESDYPHVSHGEYIKACIRGVASGLGVSYVSLGNDLESVNYSSARVGILEEREQFKRLQARLTARLHAQVFAAWLPHAMLRVESLRTLDSGRQSQYLAAATWQPRRWQGIDPVKEAQAAETNLKLGLTSRRRLILERGEDPDEVFNEIEAEAEMFGPVGGTAAPAAPAEPEEPDVEEPDDAVTEDEDTANRLRNLRVIGGMHR